MAVWTTESSGDRGRLRKCARKWQLQYHVEQVMNEEHFIVICPEQLNSYL